MNDQSHVDPGEFDCTTFRIAICLYVGSLPCVLQHDLLSRCFDKSACLGSDLSAYLPLDLPIIGNSIDRRERSMRTSCQNS